MLKTFVLLNILWKQYNFSKFLSGFSDEYKRFKRKAFYFEIKMFCNNINVFTITSDQFKESLQNKSIIFENHPAP